MTKRESRQVEYEPEVVAAWTEHSEVRKKKTDDQYSQCGWSKLDQYE